MSLSLLIKANNSWLYHYLIKIFKKIRNITNISNTKFTIEWVLIFFLSSSKFILAAKISFFINSLISVVDFSTYLVNVFLLADNEAFKLFSAYFSVISSY